MSTETVAVKRTVVVLIPRWRTEPLVYMCRDEHQSFFGSNTAALRKITFLGSSYPTPPAKELTWDQVKVWIAKMRNEGFEVSIADGMGMQIYI